MTLEQLKEQREEARKAAVRWDEGIKHSRYGCISDQERSTELWRKVRAIDFQIQTLNQQGATA